MTAIIKGAAKVDSNGKVTQLGPKAAPDEVVTVQDVQDPAKLAKLATRILATLALVRRTFVPRRLDFEDQVVTSAGNPTTLVHNFGGRVRWWVVQWSSGSAAAPIFIQSVSTDANTLIIFSYQAGTATIRVEEAG